LWLAAGAALAQSLVQAPAPTRTPRPAFEVVSIKPNHAGDGRVMIRIAPGGRLEAHNITVKFLLEDAYGVKDNQVSGAPGWLDSEHYDIEAKPEDASADQKLGPEERNAQLKLMLQSMLEDRFKLALHHETKELSVYALVVAKSGPKLHESPPEPAVTPGDSAPPDAPGSPGGPALRHGIMMKGRGDLTVNSGSLDMFAAWL